MGLRFVLIGTYQAVKRGEVDVAGEGENLKRAAISLLNDHCYIPAALVGSFSGEAMQQI